MMGCGSGLLLADPLTGEAYQLAVVIESGRGTRTIVHVDAERFLWRDWPGSHPLDVVM